MFFYYANIKNNVFFFNFDKNSINYILKNSNQDLSFLNILDQLLALSLNTL